MGLACLLRAFKKSIGNPCGTVAFLSLTSPVTQNRPPPLTSLIPYRARNMSKEVCLPLQVGFITKKGLARCFEALDKCCLVLARDYEYASPYSPDKGLLSVLPSLTAIVLIETMPIITFNLDKAERERPWHCKGQSLAVWRTRPPHALQTDGIVNLIQAIRCLFRRVFQLDPGLSG